MATFVAIVYGAYGVFTAKRPMFTLRQIPSFQRSCLCGSRSSNRGPAGWHLCRRDPVETALYGGTTLGYYDTRWSRVSDQGSLAPGNFTVKVGSTITWFNADASVHTVTSTGAFDSGNLASGATYSHTFAQAGTYQYYCVIHPNMKGTIVVTP